MQITSTVAYRSFLSNLGTLNQNLETVNQQMSSGKKLLHLSDSPSDSAAVVGLKDEVAAIDQYEINANSSSFALSVADSALGSVQNVVASIYTKGSEGASGALSPGERDSLAGEIRAMRDQILDLANSNAQGRFIFAGSKVTESPFVINGDTVTFRGDEEINRIVVGETASVRQNVSGSQTFDPIFTATNALLIGLDSNDPTAIKTALGQFSSALAGLAQARSQVGADLSRLQNVSSQHDTQKTSVLARLSQLEDTNIAQAATTLAQITTARDAALSAGSSIIAQKNLFDILG